MTDLEQQSDVKHSNSAHREPNMERIRMEYEELSKGFHALRDIRYKLFSFLPLAASGFFLLFTKFGNISDLRSLIPIGLYGMGVTIGLSIYEIANLEQNKQQVARGVKVEREAGIDDGPFFIRSQHFKSRFNSEVAALWIYASTLAAWASVVVVGAIAVIH